MSFINQFKKLLNIPDSDSSEGDLLTDLERKPQNSQYSKESRCGEDGGEAGAGPSGAKVIRVGPVGASRGRIPRPPNAFMIYANTWRRKLANLFPGESNKQISVRLGKLWKAMCPEEKGTYFTLAKRVDAEHKKKYPDYVYNPKEARLRKALRDQGKLHRPKQKWKSHTDPSHLLLPICKCEDAISEMGGLAPSDRTPD